MVPTVAPLRSTIASARQRSRVAGSKAAMVVLLAFADQAARAAPTLTARQGIRLTGQSRRAGAGYGTVAVSREPTAPAPGRESRAGGRTGRCTGRSGRR